MCGRGCNKFRDDLYAPRALIRICLFIRTTRGKTAKHTHTTPSFLSSHPLAEIPSWFRVSGFDALVGPHCLPFAWIYCLTRRRIAGKWVREGEIGFCTPNLCRLLWNFPIRFDMHLGSSFYFYLNASEYSPNLSWFMMLYFNGKINLVKIYNQVQMTFVRKH